MKIWKNQKDMIKKVAMGAGAVAVITAAFAMVFFLMNKEAVIAYFSKESKEELLEEVLENNSTVEISYTIPEETNASTDTHDTENIDMEAEEAAADDIRIHGFPYILLTNQMKAGDYVDIRISFANGGDFVLLSKKKVQGIGPLREGGTNALWLMVSEEEILRLSSAVVDAYLNEGSSIYAIQYISGNQKEAVVNYVVSDLVRQLMEEDPNIIKMAENVVEGTVWKQYGANYSFSGITASKEVYPEQEEIIYLD